MEFGSIGYNFEWEPVISEEKIIMWKFNGRRTPSHIKCSLYRRVEIYIAEVNKIHNKISSCFMITQLIKLYHNSKILNPHWLPTFHLIKLHLSATFCMFYIYTHTLYIYIFYLEIYPFTTGATTTGVIVAASIRYKVIFTHSIEAKIGKIKCS